MPDLLTPESAKWVLPLAVTAVIGLSSAVFTWAKDWNASARRSRLLDEATKRVQFWDTWLKASSENGTVLTEPQKEMARTEVARVAELTYRYYQSALLQDTWTRQEYKVYRERIGVFRQFFLLYRPPNPAARRLRALIGIMIVFVLALQLLERADPDPRPSTTVVYGHVPYPPIGGPYYDENPKNGWPTTLGKLRSQADDDFTVILVCIVATRLAWFIGEYRWLRESDEDQLEAEI